MSGGQRRLGSAACYNSTLTVISRIIGYWLIHWSESLDFTFLGKVLEKPHSFGYLLLSVVITSGWSWRSAVPVEGSTGAAETFQRQLSTMFQVWQPKGYQSHERGLGAAFHGQTLVGHSR